MVLANPFPPKEGIGNYTYHLSKKLIEKGHEVVVITRGSWKGLEREFFEGIEVIKVRFIPIYPFYLNLHGKFVNKTFKSLESNIDLIHFHSPLPPLINTTCSKVTTVHTPMLTDYRFVRMESIYSMMSKISARFVSYPIEKKLFQASDLIMTVSDSVAQELKEEYHLTQDQIFVVGNGVNESFFYPKEQNAENDNKYILFSGRIEREKGLFDLVESGRYILSNRFDISFVIAGNGRDLNRLKRKVHSLGLEKKFKFLGQVSKENLVKLYQDAALFVFPSYHEGLPTALLEAMSCGIPIVATDVRGNRDLISNRKNGILVPPRNPKKLAEAISLLIGDRPLSKTYGRNARLSIEQNFTWNEVSNKVLKCYELILEKKL
jgi:glycosyltransferase involved in cell wall biosynthesis